MYYAFIENEKIVGIGQYPCVNKQYVEISEEIFDDINKNSLNDIEKYIWNGEEVVINPEWDNILLKKQKKLKIVENDAARDEALIAGVTYNDVLFDSDTDQKINLLAIVSTMGDEDTVTWFGIDNTALVCTKEDLVNIGNLITQLHSFCWTKNASIKAQIAACETIDEVEAVEVDYTQEESEEE